jgi:hypothetical protein
MTTVGLHCAQFELRGPIAQQTAEDIVFGFGVKGSVHACLRRG